MHPPHRLWTPATCRLCNHQSTHSCHICDQGLGICMICGHAEIDLREPCVPNLNLEHVPVFVFGSNLAGRHGKGAALYARQYYGAVYGTPKGRQGHSYAIPTRDGRGGGKITGSLFLNDIARFAREFVEYANHSSELFNLTRIGCGLAGYTDAQIAPLFTGTRSNVLLPPEWL